jgi:hypothetical protein
MKIARAAKIRAMNAAERRIERLLRSNPKGCTADFVHQAVKVSLPLVRTVLSSLKHKGVVLEVLGQCEKGPKPFLYTLSSQARTDQPHSEILL